MKFAKELEDDLVPEWRLKYLNYKQGKKRITAISRALKNVNRTPKTPARPGLPPQEPSYTGQLFTQYDFNARHKIRELEASPDTLPHQANGGTGLLDGRDNVTPPWNTTTFVASPPIQSRETKPNTQYNSETDSDSRTPLKKRNSATTTSTNPDSDGYNSPASPPTPPPLTRLELPDPALDPSAVKTQRTVTLDTTRSVSAPPTRTATADTVESPQEHTKRRASRVLMKQIFDRARLKDKRSQSDNDATAVSGKLKKMATSRPFGSPATPDIQLHQLRELDAKQADFFDFLDAELAKIEDFYLNKEREAYRRLQELKAQLHMLRDQTAQALENHRKSVAGQAHIVRREGAVSEFWAETSLPSAPLDNIKKIANTSLMGKIFPAKELKLGKRGKAMQALASPQQNGGYIDENQDYVRKRRDSAGPHIPYQVARRRLKLAMQEFYRGLELLKSYALLNRTGFRKINKKYDKAVNARPPLQYLNSKVSKAHFVTSTELDRYIVAVEDLYARYFEKGNRKVAVNKLRSKLMTGNHSDSQFRNGLFIASGTCFGIAALVNALKLLFTAEGTILVQTQYLLQLYAGYFLSLLLFLMFVLNCKIWNRARVNYIFVFEYDTRHVLDYRQLAELPSFFFLLMGLFFYLNFVVYAPNDALFRYWYVVLIGLTLAILAFPAKIMYYQARRWWGYSNGRLLFAGLFPVEFRDFFLGDMYCSETYAISQIELFFCLYANDWRNPSQCNSNHSMLLGFFTTLPAIWRFLQCIRRYYDSRNWFPHLANCAKYLCNILYYMMLSLYRLHVSPENNKHAEAYRWAFLTFALINGVYASVWDIFMDWSLGQWWRGNFLRENLAFRTWKNWIYYAAIIVNVVLRQQWIFYVIFTSDLQHSAAMSFFIGLAEVIRRGIWTAFRVENEHTNNVARFRASRDIPLPYQLTTHTHSDLFTRTPRSRTKDTAPENLSPEANANGIQPPHRSPAAAAFTSALDTDLERQATRRTATTTDSNSLRRRWSVVDTPVMRQMQRVGTIIASAHAQDFEKRRRPNVVGDSPEDEKMVQHGGWGSSDEEEDDDMGDLADLHRMTTLEDERGEEGSSGSHGRTDGGVSRGDDESQRDDEIEATPRQSKKGGARFDDG